MDEEKLVQMEAVNSHKQLKSKFIKEDLVSYILHLRNEINTVGNELETLKANQMITKRVEYLERIQMISQQYNRRESIELSGIPLTVNDNELEEKCVKIIQDVTGRGIPEWQVHACHRLKNRNKVIIRFVTRKIPDRALHHRKYLKDIDKTKYGLDQNTQIYFNESLCPKMNYLFYKVRCAWKDQKLNSYNLWKGRLTVKIEENDEQILITHINDLFKLNLANEDDIIHFFDLY